MNISLFLPCPESQPLLAGLTWVFSLHQRALLDMEAKPWISSQEGTYICLLTWALAKLSYPLAAFNQFWFKKKNSNLTSPSTIIILLSYQNVHYFILRGFFFSVNFIIFRCLINLSPRVCPSGDLKITVRQDCAGTQRPNPDKNWGPKYHSRMGKKNKTAVQLHIHLGASLDVDFEMLKYSHMEEDPSFCCSCIWVHRCMV
jgi:hypothetical protein